MGVFCPRERPITVSFFGDVDLKFLIKSNTTFEMLKEISLQKFEAAFHKTISDSDVEIIDKDYFAYDSNEEVFQHLKHGKVFIEEKSYVRKKLTQNVKNSE